MGKSMSQSGMSGSLVPPPGWASENVAAEAPVSARFLLLVTLLGAVLRVFELTGQSLWVDELLTWQMIRPGIGATYLEQLLDTIQGPLFAAVTWPLIRLQDSPLMLRLPAAVAGVATIPLFGIFVSRLIGGRTARLAILLLAVNPFHVWYSQEGRGYAFLMLFSVLMALAYLDLVRGRGGYRGAVYFALATAAAAWSNLGGMFLWAAMGLGLLLSDFPRTARQWGIWSLAFGLGLLLVMPWLLKASGIWAIDRVVPGSGLGAALRGETTFSPLAWPYTLFTFFYGYSLGPSLRELHQPDRMAVLRGALPLLLAGGLPVGLGLARALFKPDRKVLLLVVWTVVPVLILTLLAVRNVKPWNPRYVAMVLPWVLLLAAWGLARLPRAGSLSATLLIAGLALWSLGGYYGNGKYAKADVRSAADFLTEANAQGDAMLVPVVSSVFGYYYKGDHEILATHGRAPLTSNSEAENFCAEVLAGRSRCWLVLGRQWYFDPGGHLLNVMSRQGHLRLVHTAPGVVVYEWTRKDAAVRQS
jgi:4-amino-4-deoxy-L-arabinose transferase-like glycosyltransferase